MSIFEINKNIVKSIKAKDFPSEKALQNLIEGNIEEIFKCRFIATEYATGDEHGGRIDTLALSEDNNPVIIEYKIKEASDLIIQSFFYLHWLNDHKGEYTNAVYNKLGQNKVKIDWSHIRVLCIAPNFKKYDVAVKAMGNNIELWQYKLYDNNILLLEEVFRKEKKQISGKSKKVSNTSSELNMNYDFEYHSDMAKDPLKSLLNDLREYLLGIDASVNENPKKKYIAYTSTQNFACVVVMASCIKIYLKIDPGSVESIPKNGRDMRGVGHWGTGDFRLKISNENELEQAKEFIKLSFKNVGG